MLTSLNICKYPKIVCFEWSKNKFYKGKLVEAPHSVLLINWEHSYMKLVLSCKYEEEIIIFFDVSSHLQI